MNPKIIKFLEDLLTDRIDNIKVDALNLYTALIRENTSNILTLTIPYTGNNFEIGLGDYNIIKDFMKTSQKIAAIKHLRSTGKRTIPDMSYPVNPYSIGLKEAKNFCEMHTWSY